MILGTGLMDIVAKSFLKQEAPRDKKYILYCGFIVYLILMKCTMFLLN